MTVERITVKQVYSTGDQYLPLHIGMDILVQEGEDRNKLFWEGKSQIDTWAAENYQKQNPHQYFPPTPSQPVQSFDPKRQDTISIIQDCNTKEELEKQKSNAEKYGLMELWNEKNKSLNS